MKFTIVILIFIVLGVRYLYLNLRNQSSKYLFLSAFIQFIIFPYTFLTIFSFPLKEGEMTGAFNQELSIDFVSVLSFLLLIFYKPVHKREMKSNNIILMIFILFCILSFFNPFNQYKIAVIAPLISIAQIFLFLFLCARRMDITEINKGIFDGLFIVSMIQLSLTILFPILNYLPALDFFYEGDQAASYWAFRRDGYPSAVGTFVHPGNLALFLTLSSVYFFSCIQNAYKIKKSLIILLVNSIIIIFTFSRASYISFGIVLFFLIYTKSNNLFSFQNYFKSILFLIIVLVFLFFTPVFDLFFNSDSQDMFDARLIHFSFVTEFLEISNWMGVGLNTHVYYMNNFFRGYSMEFDFFLSNPIHNIFLIICVETGIIGLIFILRYFYLRVKHNIKFGSVSVIQLINRTFAAALLVYFIYGNSGWAGATKQIYPLIIIFGFFSYYKFDSK